MFRIGQRVRCVNVRPLCTDPASLCEAWSLDLGAVYTIEDCFWIEDVVAVTLQEIEYEHPDGDQGAFHAWRFRALDTGKLDTSYHLAKFSSMFDPQPYYPYTEETENEDDNIDDDW